MELGLIGWIVYLFWIGNWQFAIGLIVADIIWMLFLHYIKDSNAFY
tara:strand:- start:815 stop:952 length:138 start_codon:yes stop_codon:yes gene_type:complete